jgi:hypothetical protein
MLKCHGQYGDWLDPNMVIHLPLFGLLFAGWWRWVRRQADPFAWALPCYFALCTAYGMDSGARLLVPLVPALLVCLWLGLECLGWRPARILATAITLHLVFALGYWLAIDRPEARWLARQWPAVDTLAAQVRTAPGPIVMHDCNPELALMLELALDQWVDLNSADSRILRQAQWTIGPEDLRRPERMAFRNAPDSGGALSR